MNDKITLDYYKYKKNGIYKYANGQSDFLS